MAKSREFPLIENGKISDAALHEPILAAGKDDLAATHSIARKLGLAEEQIEELFPSKKAT